MLTEADKDRLRKDGWTIKQSGVIYDHDPGDEHVEPDRWTTKTTVTKKTTAEPKSWIVLDDKPEG